MREHPEVSESSFSVLVIEDEEVMRVVLNELLRELGFCVFLAKNAQEGIDIYQKHSQTIGLVLLDMILPDMNGHSCLRRLRQICKKSPVILMSGYLSDQKLNDLFDEGVCHFLQKPYTREDLISSMRLCCDSVKSFLEENHVSGF